MEQNCLFCKVVTGDIPSRTIYEDGEIVAFEDINPQAPVHILIIPRKHIATVLDISAQDHPLIGRLFQTAQKIARERAIAERGFRLVMNCNSEAGQTVYHIHLHLLAGRRMHWPPG